MGSNDDSTGYFSVFDCVVFVLVQVEGAVGRARGGVSGDDSACGSLGGRRRCVVVGVERSNQACEREWKDKGKAVRYTDDGCTHTGRVGMVE